MTLSAVPADDLGQPMIRVGIAGCGFIGLAHSLVLKALIDAGLVDAAVTAVFDTDADRATRFGHAHGAEVATDLDALLANIDLVLVCTWTASHLALVEAAAARNVAVFCEKPLAPTLSECERLGPAARTVWNQTGLVLRYAPVFAELGARLRSGDFGRVMVAVLRDDQYLPTQGQYASTWRADVARAGGGTLLEHSIHDVDLLRVLLGEPTTVSGTTASFAGHPGIEDLALVQLAHASGAYSSLVSVWHSVLSRPSTRRLEVFCEQACFWTEDDYVGPLHVQTSDGADVIVPAEPAWLGDLRLPEGMERALRPYAIQARAVLDSFGVDSFGVEPEVLGRPPTVDDALVTHRVVDAAYRSAAAGGVPVTVAPVHFGDGAGHLDHDVGSGL